MRDIVYQTSGYHRALWRQHKVENPAALTAQINAERRYDRFGTFAGEIYGRMFSGGEATPVAECPPGAEVYQRLAEQLEKIPQVSDLAHRCSGDEWLAGIATQAFTDDLLRALPAPDTPVEDPSQDAAAIEALRQLLATYQGNEPVEREIRGLLSALEQTRDRRAQNAAAQAAKLDDTAIRNAYRAAAATAQARIAAEQQLLEAFGVGTGPHSGRAERRHLAAKLRTMVAASDRIARIAELAGRLRRIALDRQARKPRRGTDEVTGVEQGAALERVLPAELLLADGALEMAFARKLSERALLQQELTAPPRREQGPVIVLLDSSGSMATRRADIWAAAVALAFLEIARKQHRAFALVHFGSAVLRIDWWPERAAWDPATVAEAVNFFAADGGTNFMPPLDAAVACIRDAGAFRDADIVLITDGAAVVRDAWRRTFHLAKRELQFRSYGILVGALWATEAVAQVTDEVVILADALRDDQQMQHLFERV